MQEWFWISIERLIGNGTHFDTISNEKRNVELEKKSAF